MWCEHWNIRLIEDKFQDIKFPHTLRPSEHHLTMDGLNIPFANYVKFIGVIFNDRNTLRLHKEIIEAKAFKTIIRMYSLFKSERLSDNIKLILHKALIRSVMTYACPAWELAADT
jgi:hypothetical protein